MCEAGIEHFSKLDLRLKVPRATLTQLRDASTTAPRLTMALRLLHSNPQASGSFTATAIHRFGTLHRPVPQVELETISCTPALHNRLSTFRGSHLDPSKSALLPRRHLHLQCCYLPR